MLSRRVEILQLWETLLFAPNHSFPTVGLVWGKGLVKWLCSPPPCACRYIDWDNDNGWRNKMREVCFQCLHFLLNWQSGERRFWIVVVLALDKVSLISPMTTTFDDNTASTTPSSTTPVVSRPSRHDADSMPSSCAASRHLCTMCTDWINSVSFWRVAYKKHDYTHRAHVDAMAVVKSRYRADRSWLVCLL